MPKGFRTSIRKSLFVALVVSALGLGYVAHIGVDSTSGRPAGAPVETKKLTANDLLLAAATAQGIHLRYAGITTGALNASHTNDIPIKSFQFGLSRPVSDTAGGGRTVGNVSVAEINLTHTSDKFSIPLLKASLNGNAATSNLYFTNLAGAGGTPFDFLSIDLGSTLLSSFSMSSGGGVPTESFSLNFVTMTFRYKIAGTTTVQTVSYNIATRVVS